MSRGRRQRDTVLGPSSFARSPDGRRLHYRVLQPAESKATIIWVSGMGWSGLYWAPLHQRLGSEYGSVTMDRAGFGLSDDHPTAPTLDQAAEDLAAVIDATAVSDAARAPIVLAGHSWGGPIARLAASLRPESVSGLLLICVLSNLLEPDVQEN